MLHDARDLRALVSVWPRGPQHVPCDVVLDARPAPGCGLLPQSGLARTATERYMTQDPRHALTVDVEDWYQVSAFEAHVDRTQWTSYASRVVDNTKRMLDLFAKHEAKGTFFTLGWVAEQHPGLIAEIHAAGHEIASHGYEHRLVYSMDPDAFRTDLERARRALEAAAPVSITSFRAPSFSIREDTSWALRRVDGLGLHNEQQHLPRTARSLRHTGLPPGPRAPGRRGGARNHRIPHDHLACTRSECASKRRRLATPSPLGGLPAWAPAGGGRRPPGNALCTPLGD